MADRLPFGGLVLFCLCVLSGCAYSQQQQKGGPTMVPEVPMHVYKEETYDSVLGGPPPHHFELACPAMGDLPLTYKWYKWFGTANQTLLNPATDSRYTLDEYGTLHVNDEAYKNTGVECPLCASYTCVVENKWGSVFSMPVVISAAYFGETTPAHGGSHGNQVIGHVNTGVVLEATLPEIRTDSDLFYLWVKGPATRTAFTTNYINSDDQHIFPSRNGKLYFPSLQLSDAGNYSLMAGIEAKNEQRIFGTYDYAILDVDNRTIHMYDTMTRYSQPVTLIVQDDNSGSQHNAPIIQDDFPRVYPATPLKGHNFYLECLAFGSPPLYYNWFVNGRWLSHMSVGSSGSLSIVDADLTDSGTYECIVNGVYLRSISVVVEARPYFSPPLADKVVNKGSNLVWTCEAEAVPSTITYAWFKDTVSLAQNPVQGIVVGPSNELHIPNVDPLLHAGMYQCVASNIHGMTASTAQLVVNDPSLVG